MYKTVCQNIKGSRVVVVAQLIERSLSTSKDIGSKSEISNFYKSK